MQKVDHLQLIDLTQYVAHNYINEWHWSYKWLVANEIQNYYETEQVYVLPSGNWQRWYYIIFSSAQVNAIYYSLQHKKIKTKKGLMIVSVTPLFY